MSLRESIERIEEYDRHRQFLIAQSERSAGVSPDEAAKRRQTAQRLGVSTQAVSDAPENAVLREQLDKIWRDTQDSDALRRRMMQPDFYDASKNKRPIGESVENAVIILIVTILSIGYLLWIRRLLKSKTAKSVPGEIFRDAATVVGLLFALALFSKMVYDSIDARHFRSAMFIAVSSVVLPYLCMMYLADGYRRPYPWRAKILYPQTAAILAYWLMLYAANIADGEGSGNVMVSLFGLFLSSVFCVALKIKLAKSKNQQD